MADYGLNGPCINHLCVLGSLPGAIDSSEDLAKDVLFASGDILESRAKRILLELCVLGHKNLLLTDML